MEERHGMGWIPDYPDLRDYTERNEKVIRAFGLVRNKAAVKAAPSVDLRPWCSPIEDQGRIGSCTANAAAGLYEYFESKAFGSYTDASRLFLYKVTRNLMGLTGDTGATMRATMGAMALFGAPPEKYWPYAVEDFEKEPGAFHYSFARNYQALLYIRLDPAGTAPADRLAKIKSYLAASQASMLGFTVYSSISQAEATGKVPFPLAGEKALGGHAVAIVGYDDGMKIRNAGAGGKETTGALLFRNSWGRSWGQDGYGWLPYAYVLDGLAVDVWSMTKAEWMDTQQFDIP